MNLESSNLSPRIAMCGRESTAVMSLIHPHERIFVVVVLPWKDEEIESNRYYASGKYPKQ